MSHAVGTQLLLVCVVVMLLRIAHILNRIREQGEPHSVGFESSRDALEGEKKARRLT